MKVTIVDVRNYDSEGAVRNDISLHLLILSDVFILVTLALHLGTCVKVPYQSEVAMLNVKKLCFVSYSYHSYALHNLHSHISSSFEPWFLPHLQDPAAPGKNSHAHYLIITNDYEHRSSLTCAEMHKKLLIYSNFFLNPEGHFCLGMGMFNVSLCNR